LKKIKKFIMKYFSKLLIPVIALVAFFASCDKVDDLPSYQPGSAVALTSSVATIAAAPADSNNVAMTLSWTSPKYAQDSAKYKFVVQVDSAGRNFSKAVSKTFTGVLSGSFTNKELNVIMLGYGFSFNVPYDMDVRVISSYGNNNEQYTSNTLKVKMTPYKVPPKVGLPAGGKLFLVGDASQGGWNNPVPVPNQEFARLDETTWAGVFNIVGGKNYLVLPVNGSWDHKYSVADASVPAESGDFAYDNPSNFNGPAASGWYLIVLNFQSGKFTVTPAAPVPDNLFIVGDATPGQWNNPVPTPSQQFIRLNSSEFELSTLAMTSGKSYLLLPVNGSWDHKYGGTEKLGGALLYDGAVPGSNTPSPDVNGNYKININFASVKYTLTKL
jgi:hypothetical protein